MDLKTTIADEIVSLLGASALWKMPARRLNGRDWKLESVNESASRFEIPNDFLVESAYRALVDRKLAEMQKAVDLLHERSKLAATEAGIDFHFDVTRLKNGLLEYGPQKSLAGSVKILDRWTQVEPIYVAAANAVEADK